MDMKSRAKGSTEEVDETTQRKQLHPPPNEKHWAWVYLARCRGNGDCRRQLFTSPVQSLRLCGLWTLLLLCGLWTLFRGLQTLPLSHGLWASPLPYGFGILLLPCGYWILLLWMSDLALVDFDGFTVQEAALGKIGYWNKSQNFRKFVDCQLALVSFGELLYLCSIVQ